MESHKRGTWTSHQLGNELEILGFLGTVSIMHTETYLMGRQVSVCNWLKNSKWRPWVLPVQSAWIYERAVLSANPLVMTEKVWGTSFLWVNNAKSDPFFALNSKVFTCNSGFFINGPQDWSSAERFIKNSHIDFICQ